MRVVVLGAGFGGLELTTRLSEEFGDDVDVVLIDRADGFVFGFSKLEVMFGRAVPSGVHHSYSDLVKPGVRFVQATVESIDPVGKRVETDGGTFDADILVIALGADLDPGATPGLVESGHEFYTVAGAFALPRCAVGIRGWSRDRRRHIDAVQVPAGAERDRPVDARLPHPAGVSRSLRDRPRDAARRAHPPSPAASKALLAAFAERGIAWHPERLVRELDPARKVAVFQDGSELPFDLFLGVPVHRVPAVVEASGMCVDGWIPVNPLTLETSYPDVYAVGDVTSVGTPKAGVFAEGQAAVAADGIAARIRADAPSLQLRRAWDLLPRVRSRSGRQGRCHVRERAATRRRLRRAVGAVRRRQGRFRHQPDSALVRPRMVGIRTNCSLSPRTPRRTA